MGKNLEAIKDGDYFLEGDLILIIYNKNFWPYHILGILKDFRIQHNFYHKDDYQLLIANVIGIKPSDQEESEDIKYNYRSYLDLVSKRNSYGQQWTTLACESAIVKLMDRKGSLKKGDVPIIGRNWGKKEEKNKKKTEIKENPIIKPPPINEVTNGLIDYSGLLNRNLLKD